MSFFCQTYGGGEITWIAAELYAPFTGRFGKSSTQVGVGWEGICDPGGYTHSIFLWEGTQHLLTRYLFSFWMSRVYTYIHIVSFRLDFVRFFLDPKALGPAIRVDSKIPSKAQCRAVYAEDANHCPSSPAFLTRHPKVFLMDLDLLLVETDANGNPVTPKHISPKNGGFFMVIYQSRKNKNTLNKQKWNSWTKMIWLGKVPETIWGHSWNLRWTLKMAIFQRSCLFQTIDAGSWLISPQHPSPTALAGQFSKPSFLVFMSKFPVMYPGQTNHSHLSFSFFIGTGAFSSTMLVYWRENRETIVHQPDLFEAFLGEFPHFPASTFTTWGQVRSHWGSTSHPSSSRGNTFPRNDT